MPCLPPLLLAEPANADLFGLPGWLLHALLLLATALTLFWILRRRMRVLLQAAPDPRMDQLGVRLARLLRIGFAQSRQPRYLVAGVLHILVFFGFLVLLFRSLTLLGEGFVPGFTLPGLGAGLGDCYSSFKDWTALVVLLSCAALAVRRLAFKPARYHDRHATRPHGAEAILILCTIALLMLADAFYEGSQLAVEGGASWRLPLASAAAGLLEGGSEARLGAIGLAAFWIHNLALCAFACYLPVGKHFHVYTALPNVFFSKLPPGGRVKPPRHGVASDELEQIGVGQLSDFSWKHLLDFYSCTDCGRCSDHCPAYNTGAPLSPRQISIKCRDEIYETKPAFGKAPEGERPELVGGLISDEELWACTTCGACEDACPVTIEYIDKVVDMRRFLVDEGRVPKSLQKALASIEKRGNPYGKMGRKRGDWIRNEEGEECGVRVLKKGEEAEVCYFTDSAVAFDPRIGEIGRALGRVLSSAGVDCGTLGKDEKDSGHEARRIGEEGLFEMLREENEEALASRDIGRIICSDPHAFNSLRNDYELDTEVLHHSQVLRELISAGKLKPGASEDGRTYTFHDPCYLGRQNGEYEAPREVLAAIPGLKTVEMKKSRNESFCCGGGSLYLFHEGESEERMGEKRVKMAEQAGAQVIVTACPFCLINFEDAIKTSGREEEMEVIDLAELVANSLPATQSTQSQSPQSQNPESQNPEESGTDDAATT